MDEQVTAVPVERIGKAPLARIGLVGAAAAALVAVGILAAAASASPGGILASAQSPINPTSISANAAGLGMPEGPGDPGNDQMGQMGPMGGHRGGMGGPGGITITAISGSSISLATEDGWTRTITVGSGTTYQENGTAIGLSDLKVGDQVQFRETRGTNGTYAIETIAIIPPHATGIVSAVSGSSITITGRDGSTITITVTSTTTYEVNRAAGSLADIKTGMVLVASGTKDAGGNLTATRIRAIDPGKFGPGHFGPGQFGPGHRDFPGNGNEGSNGGSTPLNPTAPTTGTSNG
jgi:hypothetical protein